MNDAALQIANILFFLFHTSLILFNLFGWIPSKTRKANLTTLLLTFGSWIGLGIWYGWGYCPLTDWHYRILERLGQTKLPSSYIAFLVEEFSGWLPSEQLTNHMTLILALAALSCSLWANFRPYFRTKT